MISRNTYTAIPLSLCFGNNPSYYISCRCVVCTVAPPTGKLGLAGIIYIFLPAPPSQVFFTRFLHVKNHVYKPMSKKPTFPPNATQDTSLRRLVVRRSVHRLAVSYPPTLTSNVESRSVCVRRGDPPNHPGAHPRSRSRPIGVQLPASPKPEHTGRADIHRRIALIYYITTTVREPHRRELAYLRGQDGIVAVQISMIEVLKACALTGTPCGVRIFAAGPQQI